MHCKQTFSLLRHRCAHRTRHLNDCKQLSQQYKHQYTVTNLSLHNTAHISISLRNSSTQFHKHIHSNTTRSLSTPSQKSAKYNNITAGIQAKVGVNLHNQPNHPICIIKQHIFDYFNKHYTESGNTTNSVKFHIADHVSPIVSTQKCFDDLFIDATHISRQPSDTFYYDKNTVLRTHTSAHEREMLEAKHNAFLIAGDCYRRDEIDATHYPVFHQCEGVRVFENVTVEYAVQQLKSTLEGLARHLFGQNVQLQWDDDTSFPWTDPSFELYVMYNGEWLECLGSGIIKQKSLQQAGLHNHVAWAFGMGLDRLAMILYNIPDIRLFWSIDQRFLSQFKAGDVTTQFQPFSKYPYCYKDITFWLPEQKHTHHHDSLANIEHSGVTMESTDNTQTQQQRSIAATGYHDNDFSAIVREVAGDLVEQIDRIDTFQHPKTKRWSLCYRITYRDLNRSLTNEEVDALQIKVREQVVQQLGVQIR